MGGRGQLKHRTVPQVGHRYFHSEIDRKEALKQDFARAGKHISDSELKELRDALTEYSGGGSPPMRWASRGETYEEAILKSHMTRREWMEYKRQAQLIEKWLEVAPKFNEKIYRGWGERVADYEKLALAFASGKKITFNGMTSSSSSEGVAKRFLKGSPTYQEALSRGNPRSMVRVMYHLPEGSKKYGSSIQSWSGIFSEEEVLFSKKAKFRIKNMEQMPEYVLVTLREV